MLDLEHRRSELTGAVASVAGTFGELEDDQHFVGLLECHGLDDAAARQQAIPLERTLAAVEDLIRVLDDMRVLREERGRGAVVVAVESSTPGARD